MIEGISLKTLRNSEFSQFMSDVLTIVSNNKPTALKVEAEHAALAAVLGEINAIFKAKRGFATTEELEELDARRDKTITGLGLLVNAQTYHPSATIRRYAELLNGHLKNYGGNIARQNYASETAIINNILTEWASKSDLSEAAAALQLSDWTTDLKEANTAFNEKYLQRNTEMSSVSADTLKDKRNTAAEAYYELRDLIVAYHTIKKGAEPFSKTVKELNALVGQYNHMRSGRKGKGDDPSEDQLEAVAQSNGKVPHEQESE
ncbi:MAG: DUF6261 family protein [Imperialibacter sp.]|uniref:DUF6261 family protein n=1 Tax=Imperialibacter sp. TaxID=2038411 RepID=UPI003A8A067E